VSGNAKLSQPARALIEDSTTQPFLSVASLWEMAIKISLGKLTVGQPFETFVMEQLTRNGIGLLSISLEHTTAIISLPFHHRDPFDRLLLAQAQVENLPFISADPIFDMYGVKRIW
jgi:PIN domain nuclease of toxin-antitoxin system